MKFDEHLSAFLYKNRSLTLEGIGTFTLDSKVSVPGANEKEVFYPIDGLTFIYSPRGETDELLIQFLVERLGKIKPLVRSDLESFLSNIRQFINLGKPYTIEGIGTLSKNNKGEFEFTPGTFLPVKEELASHKEVEEYHHVEQQSSSAGRMVAVILIIIAALAALGGIGWGVYNIIQKYQQPADTAEEQVISDTIAQPQTDTLSDSSSSAFPTIDSLSKTVSYKMAFEVIRYHEEASDRIRQLKEFGTIASIDTISQGDSLRYRLYIPVAIFPADTTRVKDSLSLILGKRVYIPRGKSIAAPRRKPVPKTVPDTNVSTGL